MPEQRWLTTELPGRLLLGDYFVGFTTVRQRTLIAVALLRRPVVWRRLTARDQKKAVRALEKFADGAVRYETLRRACNEARTCVTLHRENTPGLYAAQALNQLSTPWYEGYRGPRPYDLAGAARQLVRAERPPVGPYPYDSKPVRLDQCDIVRDVVNPFYVPTSHAWPPQAVSVAAAAYAGRSFSTLPVAADVLEEAGCTDARLLGHLRGPGPHVRGCWAVDALLGEKSS